jgi:hypothetical protein
MEKAPQGGSMMVRLALTLFAYLLLAALAGAGGTPKAKPDRPPQERKTWTNEEVEALRTKGLISLVGQEPGAPAAEEAPRAETATERAPRPERAKDPEWYAEQVAKLREDMAPIDAEIHRIRRELASRQTPEGGVNLNVENPGITPESSLWVLEGRKRELQVQFDALEDQARRNSIGPGALR